MNIEKTLDVFEFAARLMKQERFSEEEWTSAQLAISQDMTRRLAHGPMSLYEIGRDSAGALLKLHEDREQSKYLNKYEMC